MNRGGCDGGESGTATRGGCDGGESGAAKRGGWDGGESVMAIAEAASVQPAINANKLRFIQVSPVAVDGKSKLEALLPADHISDAHMRIPSGRGTMYASRWGRRTIVPANFTQLLSEWRSGHPQALERLTPMVYDELRRLARSYMRAERSSHTLQATAVVHEAFMRLIQANVALQDRGHFFALASRLMRRVLVDHAKSRGRLKRQSAAEHATETGGGEVPPPPDFDVIALDDALAGLQQLEPRLAQVIELHYFGGLTYDQIAEATDTSAATVHRNIRLARAWLLNEISAPRI
jgi:RNA polymerase sigma factor (TIGR02999 family)